MLKNKCKAIVIALIISASVSATAFAVTPSSNRNWLEDSPRENIFKVEGDSREFVLLEKTDDDDSKFFVFGKDFYGNVAFDTGGNAKFDPNNPKNIAYWLNNDFLQFGYGGENGKTFKLPTEIIEHIDRNHVWKIEAGLNIPEHYEECGVALLSQEELLKHKDKIGVKDTIENADTFNVQGWLLRDVYSSVLSYRYGAPDDGYEGFGDIWSWGIGDKEMATRPAFYIDKDFFKEVRVNVSDLGENIIKMIKDNYSKEELEKIYSNEELWDVFGYKSGITVNDVIIADESGSIMNGFANTDYINISVSLNSTTPDSRNIMVMSILYGADNCPISFVYRRMVISDGDSKDVTMGLHVAKKEKGSYVKVYALECGNRLKTLSNAIRIPMSESEEN